MKAHHCFKGCDGCDEPPKATPSKARELAVRVAEMCGFYKASEDTDSYSLLITYLESLLQTALGDARNSVNMDCMKCRRACAYYCRECFAGELAAEREACAKVAEDFVKDSGYPIEKMSAEVIAAKIRQRGEPMNCPVCNHPCHLDKRCQGYNGELCDCLVLSDVKKVRGE